MAEPAVPGVEIERAFNLAARAMQRRFGASGTEEDIEAALSEFFAPILAEKEREIAAAIESHDAWAKSWHAKLEAAEAALAGERERCALVAERFMAAGKIVDGQLYAGPNTPRAIAAAIRADKP